MVVAHGRLPWISLTLALSFALYTLLRKQARIDAVAGLLVETSLLAPLAAGWLGWLWWRGEAHFGTSTGMSVLLLSAGAVTALPLVWFGLGVHRLRLSTIGLLQYVAPTLQFTLAVVAYREPFGTHPGRDLRVHLDGARHLHGRRHREGAAAGAGAGGGAAGLKGRRPRPTSSAAP